MSKIWQIAVREFGATVFTRAFIIGLLIFPLMVGVFITIGPRLFADRPYDVEGELAVVDPTGEVAGELSAALASNAGPAEFGDALRRAGTPPGVASMAQQLARPPNLTVVERPAGADLEQEKAWLRVRNAKPAHLALAVIHPDAVTLRPGLTKLGSYDLYVPPKQDQRVEIAVKQALSKALIAARARVRDLDRATIDALVNVPRVDSVTVSDDAERGTVGAFGVVLPLAFMLLLFLSVMGSAGGLLTTTVEEKSSRVIEVLLSAVSPMQLMAGKLLGHVGISLLMMSVYIALGLAGLSTFALLGLLDASLIGYLFVFYLIAFFTIGSLMMAAGAAVNDMREAQSLLMPMSLILMAIWFVWFPISRDPNSTLALVLTYVPLVGPFVTLLRIASTSPPPAWQIWLSVAAGCGGVVASVWFSSKVFKIGLLMFGKPPNLATLIRWVRAS
ncbi:MAG TPA: ABC transporter permease [Gammaproteobacteria bacterium]|nr:ABC transporter permease [Gammaproteobacteria bacterium]